MTGAAALIVSAEGDAAVSADAGHIPAEPVRSRSAGADDRTADRRTPAAADTAEGRAGEGHTSAGSGTAVHCIAAHCTAVRLSADHSRADAESRSPHRHCSGAAADSRCFLVPNSAADAEPVRSPAVSEEPLPDGSERYSWE